MTDLRPIIIIAGPTASGKTALALDMAAAFNGTVINADSMQVYRELRILTARPGDDEEARAPHKLFGVLPASEVCSVGRWLTLATAEIETAWKEGRLPLIVGGTGLYIKALTEGLAAIPEIPDAVNEEVRALYDSLGGEAFKEALAKLDGDAARRLPAGDSQRLTRAMAVVRATGKPLAQWQGEQGQGPAVAARFLTIALVPGREDLYAACEARFKAMLEGGVIDEVHALLALGLDASLPAMKALGVPELGRHVNGEISLDEAADAAKQATRNFAKRQLTWLRNQVNADHVIEDFYGPANRSQVVDALKVFIKDV
ncbi:MAG TPA: tRNA (adenosine(37)-N6)-dimethylallyltransferase MiaA [Rhodospirillales bacterium]|nr:tRNA (adenosine(37)-N6)-dimethylallyltransferase MiaA [Rhodospirillales bacterium]